MSSNKCNMLKCENPNQKFSLVENCFFQNVCGSLNIVFGLFNVFKIVLNFKTGIKDHFVPKCKIFKHFFLILLSSNFENCCLKINFNIVLLKSKYVWFFEIRMTYRDLFFGIVIDCCRTRRGQHQKHFT